MFPLRDNQPTYRIPHVTYLLITANVLVYLYEVMIGSMQNSRDFAVFVYYFGAIPSEIIRVLLHPGQWFGLSGNAPWFGYPMGTLFTSMFLHGGFFHVLGNMVFLYIFGDNIEDALGHWQFLLFYVICGLVASATHVGIDLLRALMGWGQVSAVPMVGASGAIGGVLGAYILLYPGARVLTLVFFFIITLIEIPAYWFLGIWFLIQFVSGVGDLYAGGGVGGTAFWAHIGGFLIGLYMARMWLRWKGYATGRTWWT